MNLTILSDVSKCMGANCPVRKKCHRHTAKSNERQVWSEFTYDLRLGSCKAFIPNQACLKMERTK